MIQEQEPVRQIDEKRYWRISNLVSVNDNTPCNSQQAFLADEETWCREIVFPEWCV